MEINEESKFAEYFQQWVLIYKKGAVRDVTLQKYNNAHTWIMKIAPDVKVKELTRNKYQMILNEYAEYHEKQTTMDFHHHLKGSILDAVDEGLIKRNPTRKAIIKGKVPGQKNRNS